MLTSDETLPLSTGPDLPISGAGHYTLVTREDRSNCMRDAEVHAINFRDAAFPKPGARAGGGDAASPGAAALGCPGRHGAVMTNGAKGEAKQCENTLVRTIDARSRPVAST